MNTREEEQRIILSMRRLKIQNYIGDLNTMQVEYVFMQFMGHTLLHQNTQVKVRLDEILEIFEGTGITIKEMFDISLRSNLHMVITYVFNWYFDSAGEIPNDRHRELYNQLLQIKEAYLIEKGPYVVTADEILKRLPEHWRSNIDMTTDQALMIEDVFKCLSSEEKHDAFTAFREISKVLDNPINEDKLITIKADLLELKNLEIPSGTFQEIALPSRITNYAKGNRDDNIDITKKYLDIIISRMEELPKLLLLVSSERIMNKVVEDQRENSIEFINLVQAQAYKKFREAIDNINSNPKSKWVVSKAIYSNDYIATTKEVVKIFGFDDVNEEEGFIDKDYTYSYGLPQIKFNISKILNINLGGLANKLEYISTECHPHLSENGSNIFCAGNLSTRMLNCIRGRASESFELGGSETTTPDKYFIIDQIGEYLASGKTDNQEIMIDKLSDLLHINDIESYLTYAYTLIAKPTYDNPYVYLTEDKLDMFANENDGDTAFSSFDEVEDDCEIYATNYQVIKNEVMAGRIDISTIIELKESGYTAPRERGILRDIISTYDTSILNKEEE